MTIGQTLQETIKELRNAGIEEPNLKARMLLAFYLKTTKEKLIIKEKEEFLKEWEENWKKAMADLSKGMPIQYLIHHQEFMGLDFYVDENVLIPQPDTEILVEKAIALAKRKENPKVLDLCTGSGCIGISIAHYCQNAQVTVSDISTRALQIASKNAQQNQVNIELIESDLWKNIQEHSWDIIISNPPYIAKEEVKKLPAEVQREPKIALDGGNDGLDFYRKIISRGSEFLVSNGYLGLEIGYDQKESVTSLLETTKKYKNIACYQDLARRDRVIVAQAKE